MRLNFALAALAATTAFATPALAAPVTDTAAAEARGTVLQSLTLTKESDLDFGTVAGSAASAGTVSVDADKGLRTATGGVALLPGAFSRAEFTGLGEKDQQVTLTLKQPVSGVLTSGSNSIGATLKLDSKGSSRVIDSTGKFTVYVGGDFDIAVNQPNGLYSAQFDLTAVYQ